MRQPWAWVGWLVAVLVVLSITRNPLYLVLILLCVAFVGIALRQSGAEMPGPFSLWKLAGWIILLATLFNGITSHYGETILFTIAGKVPLISGNITLEALVYGMINGLVLIGMLASFTVLNLALPVRDLISLIPRAFFPMAVVTSIAVTYLPTTLRQFRQIREAQAVRGHQMRTIRDWLPLLMPLLVRGLEHAMQLAEAMTARGFASTRSLSDRQLTFPRLGMMIGLVLTATGWIIQLAGGTIAGWIMIVGGAALILGGLWYLGRQTRRTSYHHQTWGWRDWVTLSTAVVIILACTLPLAGMDRQSLEYEPYPLLSWPAFNPILGMIMLGLIIPGLMVVQQGSEAGLHRDRLKEGV